MVKPFCQERREEIVNGLEFILTALDRDGTKSQAAIVKRAIETIGRERDKVSVSEDVREFMNKFGFLGEPYTPERLEQRDFLLEEEFREYKTARAEGDRIGMIDALVDIVYVAVGTALAEGFDFDEHWKAVQNANMAKERGTKSTRPNSGGFDVVKPAGWVGPDARHRELLGLE